MTNFFKCRLCQQGFDKLVKTPEAYRSPCCEYYYDENEGECQQCLGMFKYSDLIPEDEGLRGELVCPNCFDEGPKKYDKGEENYERDRK